MSDLILFPFHPNWANDFIVGEEYLTTILSSPTGAEQRICHRITPRRDFEYSILVHNQNRAFAEEFIRLYSASALLVPLWVDAQIISGGDANLSSFKIDDIEFSNYKVGGYIAIIDHLTYSICDYFKIVDITGNIVTTSGQSSKKFGASAYIAPAVPAFLNLSNGFEVEFVRASDAVSTAYVKLFQYNPDNETPDDADNNTPSYLVYDGLAVNQYSATDGVLPKELGTAEGQFTLISGVISAADSLIDYDPASSGFYKKLGTKMYNSIGWGNRDGAIVRQNYPSSDEDLFLLNDLFVAGTDVESNTIYFEQEIEVSIDGTLKIPPNLGGSSVTDVYMVYPSTARLGTLSTNGVASSGLGSNLQTKISKNDWIRSNGYAIITVPKFNDNGDLNVYSTYKIVYRCDNGTTIPHGSALQVFPSWNPLPLGYCIMSAGIYRYFDLATNDILYSNKPSFDTNMLKLFLFSTRKTLAKELEFWQLKNFIKKSTKIQPIHTFEEYNGTYCFSNGVGEVASQSVNGNPSCFGFKKWSRDNDGYSVISPSSGVYGIGVSGFFALKNDKISCDIYLSRALNDGEYCKLYISKLEKYNKDSFYTVDLSKYNLQIGEKTSLTIPFSDFANDDIPVSNWDLSSDLMSNYNVISSQQKTINCGISIPYPDDNQSWEQSKTPSQDYNRDLVW